MGSFLRFNTFRDKVQSTSSRKHALLTDRILAREKLKGFVQR